jgi:hypothetical protein
MEGEPAAVAHTKHGDLTLDQIGEMQPGMARLMLEVSERFWIMYHAARAGNWELAHHEFRELRKTTQIAAVVRPTYREALAEYDSDFLRPLDAALRAKDWEAVEVATARGIDAANDAHRRLGYAYIEWQMPASPPPYLNLSPRGD